MMRGIYCIWGHMPFIQISGIQILWDEEAISVQEIKFLCWINERYACMRSFLIIVPHSFEVLFGYNNVKEIIWARLCRGDPFGFYLIHASGKLDRRRMEDKGGIPPPFGEEILLYWGRYALVPLVNNTETWGTWPQPAHELEAKIQMVCTQGHKKLNKWEAS